MEAKNADSPEKTPEKVDSKTAILRAAVVEFSRHGLSGTRMEHIASRSGFNKALVYRYFKDKVSLFGSTMRFKFLRRFKVAEKVPVELSDALVYWFHRVGADEDFLRLIMMEALSDEGEEVSCEKERAEYYVQQEESVRDRQSRGDLDPVFHPRAAMLAFVALFSYPHAFPNLTRLMIGHSVGSDEFKAIWETFLCQFAQKMRAPATSGESHEDAS
ncbi:MAG: TetR/AcrR family transcriptional regulator [Deltaproteobacteria bacterium]|nr:TetR/AcrR family transcriptional regulator [Deltaproteobacteria bacterium]